MEDVKKVEDGSIEKTDDISIEKVSGGSIEGTGVGYRVFNSDTQETYGILKNYGDAVNLAKRNKVSALGTWGDSQGLKGRREWEDKKGYTSKIAGFDD